MGPTLLSYGRAQGGIYNYHQDPGMYVIMVMKMFGQAPTIVACSSPPRVLVRRWSEEAAEKSIIPGAERSRCADHRGNEWLAAREAHAQG